MSQVLTRLYFRVTGRVQGVGFRWFVKTSADTLGLNGWVRNLPDGSVELEAEGAALALARLKGRLETGPSYAQVDRVDSRTLAPTGDKSFEIV